MFVEKTQSELGAVISTPKLTEKLLSRPPFRFLHDVVMSFHKETGFPGGVFPAEMLDAANINEKEQKVQFLELFIAAVSAATGKPVQAKPQKIVAGQEPELTNELLQLLASCASLTAEQRNAAVAKAKGGAAEASPAPVAEAEKKEKKKDKEKSKEDKEKSKEDKEKSKEDKEKSKEKSSKDRDKGKEKDGEEDKERKRSKSDKEKDKDREKSKHKSDAGDTKESAAAAASSSKESEKRASGGDAKGSDDVVGMGEKPAKADPSQTASARKPPPKAKATQEVLSNRGPGQETQETKVIKEQRRGADGRDGDGDGAKGEDDWLRVVEEQEERAKASALLASGAAGSEAVAKGYLGQQALQAKRDQDAAAAARGEQQQSVAEEDAIIIHATRKGKAGGAMADNELTKLREQLQLLTKASNPLGKFLEAIHDDIDTMARELEMWRAEAHTQALAAADAQRQTHESLREVNAQLQALEDSLNDQVMKNNIMRQTIINNDAAIETMLRMVVAPEMDKKAES